MSTVPRSSLALTVAQRVVLVVLLLTAWWLASLRMPQFVLPGPLRVAHAFVGLVQSGTFFDDLGITLYRVVAGFLLAAAVGAPLGIALGSNPRVAHFFAGARLAFGFGWRVSLVAETIGSSNGIGYRLRQAADLVQTDQVFAWTVTLVVLMLLLEAGVLKPLERRLFRWKKTD